VVAVGLSTVALGLWWLGRRPADEAPGPDGRGDLPLGPSLAFWTVSVMVVLFFTLWMSAPVWRAVHLGNLVSDPRQLLALTGLPLSFVAASVVCLDRRLAERPVWAGLLALTVLASYTYLAPRFTQVAPGAGPVANFMPAGSEGAPIQLLGVDVGTASAITSTVPLTLTWQALAPVPEDYTVFVHLLADGAKVSQSDARPCGGECPTPDWLPGQIVVDRHEVLLPPDAPPGPYRLALGLYQLGSGERVPVVGRDDGTVSVDVR
jgi:hypothetical protein